MSQTTQQIIAEAFTILGVVADGKSPTPTQLATGLTVLNDQLLNQQRDGWNLGWYPQTTYTGVAPLRDEDIGPVKYCLAAWLAPRYGVKLDPSMDSTDLTSVSAMVRDAFRQLSKRSLRYAESDLGELSRPQGGPWGGPNWM